MYKKSPTKGFSLIEIMIVILIIGIGAATVRIVIPNKDPLDDAKNAADNFIHLFSQLQDDSLMRHEDIGLYFMESHIAILSWREGDRDAGEDEIVWDVLTGGPYSDNANQLTFELYLGLESQEWVAFQPNISENETIIPQVILFESEEYEPSFIFRIGSRYYQDEYIEIRADGFNRLEANRVEF